MIAGRILALARIRFNLMMLKFDNPVCSQLKARSTSAESEVITNEFGLSVIYQLLHCFPSLDILL